MSRIQVSAERTIPAPAPALYALLADYQDGHPKILPLAFSNFSVLQGGIGAGTRIGFTLTLAGRAQETEGVVAEPEPGRILTETYAGNGAVTTFTIDPMGEFSTLRIETAWTARPGLAGMFERLIAPRVLRNLFREELDLIERWAKRRENSPHDRAPNSHQAER